MARRRRACVALLALCLGVATPIASQQPVPSLSADGRVCGVLSGRARCFYWGSFFSDYAGVAPEAGDSIPGDPGLVSIRTRASVACGLTAGGAMYCLGQSNRGAGPFTQETPGVEPCGDMRCASRLEPVATGLRFRAFALGPAVCGTTLDGKLYCWGGERKATRGDRPRLVAGAPAFVEIEANNTEFCGRTAEGRAWCWAEYQAPVLRPVPVAGTPAFASISVGTTRCGLTPEGETYCWAGLEGVVLHMYRRHHFRQMSIGDQFACGITTDGAAHCWSVRTPSGYGPRPASLDPAPIRSPVRFAVIAAGAEQVAAIGVDGQLYHWSCGPCEDFADPRMPLPVVVPYRGATSPQAASGAPAAGTAPAAAPAGTASGQLLGKGPRPSKP